MDRSQLSAVVYKKTGVALGPDDPAFALVELNRLALKEAIEETAGEIMERLNAFPERIRSSGKHLAAEVATQGMQRVVEMLAESRRTIAADTEQAQRRIADHIAKLSEPLFREVAAAVRAAQTLSRGGAVRARWLLAGAVIGVLSFVYGVAFGAYAYSLLRHGAGG
jgi:hypothetical protein